MIAVALVLALLIKTFLVQAFYIPSGSMEQTLLPGDRVLVDKLSYRFGEIKRGHVVVFNGVDSWEPEVTIREPTNPVLKGLRTIGATFGLAPPNEEDYIKRVIGLPGDRVVCCDARGRVTVNGTPLREDYLYPGDQPSDLKFDVTVPEGRLWVLGDHRGNSSDSRYHAADPGQGTIQIDHVVGRAFAKIWPLDRLDGIGRPETFDDVDRPSTAR